MAGHMFVTTHILYAIQYATAQRRELCASLSSPQQFVHSLCHEWRRLPVADAEANPANYLAQMLEQHRSHDQKYPGGKHQKYPGGGHKRLRCGVDVTIIRAHRDAGHAH